MIPTREQTAYEGVMMNLDQFETISVSDIQKVFSIGFESAKRVMDRLIEEGVVEGGGYYMRKVLMRNAIGDGYHRIVSIQDISCFGQCSLTVALPVISSFGIECAVVPTSVLSTHTSGFHDYTFRDLSGDLHGILGHWNKEGIKFDAVYTGYLGNAEDIDFALRIAKENNCPLFVDPAFGDNGKLYGLFDEQYVKEIAPLCFLSDYLLPNLTEAYALLGKAYNPNPSIEECESISVGLIGKGAKNIILKGIKDGWGNIGIMVTNEKGKTTYFHRHVDTDFHGTGDLFASVFVSGVVKGLNPGKASQLAATVTLEAIDNTVGDEKHCYGVKFEPLLSGLMARLKNI